MIDLKPCPFCGEDKLRDIGIRIHCYRCGSEAYNGVWNTRHQAAKAEGQGVERTRFEGILDLNPEWLAKACEAVRARPSEAVEYNAAKAIREYLRWHESPNQPPESAAGSEWKPKTEGYALLWHKPPVPHYADGLMTYSHKNKSYTEPVTEYPDNNMIKDFITRAIAAIEGGES